jgi:hypothetical protein
VNNNKLNRVNPFSLCNFSKEVFIFFPNKTEIMRNFILSLFTIATVFLTGCLETTQEITLNDDGSGIISNTNDMSALIGMAKQMGGGADMEKMPQEVIDSTVSMKEGADSIPNLTSEEREMARQGILRINMDMKSDKFSTKLTFPFAKISQLDAYNKLSGKIMSESLKSQMGSEMSAGSGDMPQMTSIDDYYTVEFSEGELTKKINREKYATVENDEYLKGVKEAGAMGLKMKVNYVINLPRPATKAEGKNVKLSEDKKKITISTDIDDFFDDASALEFKIKY